MEIGGTEDGGLFQAPLDQCYPYCFMVALSPHVCTPMCKLHFHFLLPTTSDKPLATQNQNTGYFRMRLFHSSESVPSLSSPQKSKHKILIGPWLDDMYPHMLIRAERTVWNDLVGQSRSWAPCLRR